MVRPTMNRDSYDAIVRQWDAARIRLSDAELRLLELALDGTGAGDRALDLGCGTGRPIAEYLTSRHLLVTGVDQSARMLEVARRRLPDAELLEARLEDFVPQRGYATAIAWDSLFHVPRVHHEAIFRRLRSVLRPGGRFALTVGGSEHAAFEDPMFGRTFFYDSHPPEVAVGLLEQVGFAVVHSEFLNPPTAGRDRGRVAIVARVAQRRPSRR
jgi:cyclopropane fatty-acyl-phospholipid synthase-like methyltransferase